MSLKFTIPPLGGSMMAGVIVTFPTPQGTLCQGGGRCKMAMSSWCKGMVTTYLNIPREQYWVCSSACLVRFGQRSMSHNEPCGKPGCVAKINALGDWYTPAVVLNQRITLHYCSEKCMNEHYTTKQEEDTRFLYNQLRDGLAGVRQRHLDRLCPADYREQLTKGEVKNARAVQQHLIDIHKELGEDMARVLSEALLD